MSTKYISEEVKAEIAEIAEMLEKVPPETRATVKGIIIGAGLAEEAAGEKKSA